MQRLLEGVSADYVETTIIADVPCDHLAVRTAGGVDFQVWIAQGSEPLPRRIVITYKDEHGQPQFWADLSNWNLAPDVFDALFAFTPPYGGPPRQHRVFPNVGHNLPQENPTAFAAAVWEPASKKR